MLPGYIEFFLMMMNIYFISTLLFLSCFLYSCQYKNDKDYDKDYKNKTSKSVINLQVGELNRQYELFTPKLSDLLDASNLLFLKFTVSEIELPTFTLASVAPNFFARSKQ